MVNFGYNHTLAGIAFLYLQHERRHFCAAWRCHVVLMDVTHSASRFDWIDWLASIPGIPADWPAPRAAQHDDDTFDPDDWPELKAA